jgi:hypothetical protein
MDPHDDIVLGGVGIGHVRQREATDTGSTISNSDGLHDIAFLWGIVDAF